MGINMKVCEIAAALGWTLLAGEPGGREARGVYAGDLLSWVMGRAKEDDLWFTVMGNVNAVAVAALGDVSAIVLTEGAALDEDARLRAESRGIPVYATPLHTAAALIKVYALCGGALLP